LCLPFDRAEEFLEVLNGKVTIGDSDTTHDAFHTLVLSSDGQATGVSVTALEGNTDIVLVRLLFASSEESCALIHDA
jgi:hypothetical protein